MADRPNKVLEHQKMVQEMVAKQRQQQNEAFAVDQRRREAQQAERDRLFALTPEGKASLERRERIRILEEAKEKFRLLCETHVRKREALRAAKFEIGLLVTAYRDIEPIPHHISERLHYKICVAPFDPEDTEDFSQEPSWVLINCPEMMRTYRGVIAFCDRPMKQGQQARIIKVSEKSCMIQPLALIPKVKR